MSIVKNAKGKYEVRVQVNGKRIRAGTYDTKIKAQVAEVKAKQRLEKLQRISLNNCGKYEPQYEETGKGLITKLVAAFRKRKAEKAKDRATTKKLERL